MQMQIFRKTVLGLMILGLTVGMIAILSCGGSSDDNTVKRQANLQGANERPTPVPNTPGSGTAALTISEDQTQITYTLTFTGLSNVTQAHIHVGDANTAGPIILFLCTNIGGAPAGAVGAQPCPTSSGTVTGTLTSVDLIPRAATAATPAVNTFSDAVTQIVNGNTYSNVHTQANPSGEIRGQDTQ